MSHKSKGPKYQMHKTHRVLNDVYLRIRVSFRIHNQCIIEMCYFLLNSKGIGKKPFLAPRNNNYKYPLRYHCQRSLLHEMQYPYIEHINFQPENDIYFKITNIYFIIYIILLRNKLTMPILSFVHHNM